MDLAKAPEPKILGAKMAAKSNTAASEKGSGYNFWTMWAINTNLTSFSTGLIMEITLEGFLVIAWYISTPYLANSNMAALQKAGFAV